MLIATGLLVGAFFLGSFYLLRVHSLSALATGFTRAFAASAIAALVAAIIAALVAPPGHAAPGATPMAH